MRLLHAGKHGPEGLRPVMGAVNAFYAVIHRLRDADALRDWAIVGDLPAGPRQVAFDWAPYADRLLVVAEPTSQSILTARRIVRIAAARRDIEALLVVSKVRSRTPTRCSGSRSAWAPSRRSCSWGSARAWTAARPSTSGPRRGFVERFGRDAPDGVRLVVASRIERPDPGCPCCGVSPERLLAELEQDDAVVVGDLEAGVGTVLRLREGDADVVVVVAQPTAKALQVARRATELAAGKAARTVVVANRVRDDEDLALIRAALGFCELVVVPDDAAIAEADRDGRAPIDADAGSPGVAAIVALAGKPSAGVPAPS